LGRTHRIAAVILWCTIVVLLAIALPISKKPLAAGSLHVLAGDSFLAAQSAPAGTIHVDACDPGPGEYGTLTGARTAASPGDTIVIQGGFYPETLDIDKALTLTASDGPALVGPWKDVGVPITSWPDPDHPALTNARVYYPSKIACGGEFPAVVYAHGRRDSGWELCEWCDQELQEATNEDYEQAEGILTRLAASGIIAISVDHSWADHLADKPEIVSNTIAYLRDQHYASGSWLEGAVDLDNVGLSGHSTGGWAVIYAASRNPPVPIRALGLIAPADWGGHPQVPGLVIHGTRDPCQVGNNPVEIYRRADAPKHLVVVTGANHFGYTDGICLEPVEDCDDGWDFSSEVGGVTGEEAHARQQRTAGNYLQAFFSYYLQDNFSALEYLTQKTDQTCDPGLPPSCGSPERSFDDLENLNVEVNVCSCE